MLPKETTDNKDITSDSFSENKINKSKQCDDSQQIQNKLKLEQNEESKQQLNDSSSQKKEDWVCLTCNKRYQTYSAFYTHKKQKHNGQPPEKYDVPRNLEEIRQDRGRPRVTDCTQKIKFTIEDKYQQKCEDSIYEFLGKLGQRGDETGRDNTVIRQYLQKPIDPYKEFPIEEFVGNEDKEASIQIHQCIQQIQKKLNENNKWDFVDPLELINDDSEEFSIYNLKALFAKLGTYNLKSTFTTISVFLIWISKELLEQSYRELCKICVPYVARFKSRINDMYSLNTGEPLVIQAKKKRIQYRQKFLDNLQQELADYLPKFMFFADVIDIKQFMEHFLTWYYHFEKEINLVPQVLVQKEQDICTEKMEKMEKNQQQQESTQELAEKNSSLSNIDQKPKTLLTTENQLKPEQVSIDDIQQLREQKYISKNNDEIYSNKSIQKKSN